MKQSAFESPSSEAQSSNALPSGTPFATAAGKDSILSQRRLRKTGPFVVHSQSIPDSRIKYAGSWPPQYESDSENINAHPTGTSAQKQQVFEEILYLFIFHATHF